ncbi:zinc metallopeptidase [Winogradskyella immobilis]|uniref:Zinc metallopeptidase n=1 Tax=Winogradskyella immobilis TaxID=2816852 RepID=A0ABS8EKM2_9FLAO|nr:zinc metallopeptidase [Winogradskyella immobilis]MCC1483773.1 zinc metallopeptidase [Winogradskyella immobilis]MCG0015867.1 zinc metallopeptidase [Winogradskyella immobilis]
MTGYYVLAGAIFLLSSYVSNKLKSKFKHYSKVQLQNGMSGKEIAEKMLADNGIYDVEVISVRGQLTDHYNPKNKTVNLSEVVYNQRNAAAAAVAAHEVGHAVQHAQAYSWLEMRSAIVPAVSISSKLSNIVIMAGLVLSVSGSAFGLNIFLLGIVLFAVTTVFTFITLPVEYDASNRALAWLKNKNIVTQQEYKGSEDALKWAARTYLVAALGSLATLLYFIMMYMNRR